MFGRFKSFKVTPDSTLKMTPASQLLRYLLQIPRNLKMLWTVAKLMKRLRSTGRAAKADEEVETNGEGESTKADEEVEIKGDGEDKNEEDDQPTKEVIRVCSGTVP